MHVTYDAVTTCTNMECVVDGERLVGFVVDDGARHWLWARDMADALMLAARSLVGEECEDVADAYYRATGNLIADMWACPLTVENLAGISFVDDDGGKRPMAEAMMACQRRGVVAGSEW